MDAGDALYEAVRNSLEAGARHISLTADVHASGVSLCVEDDGEWDACGDPFTEGYSTRGRGRGMGLSIVRSLDRDSCIRRLDGRTVLTFRCKDRDGLGQTLALLFSLCWSCGTALDVSIGEWKCSAEDFAGRLGALDRAEAIWKMRRELALRLDKVEK